VVITRRRACQMGLRDRPEVFIPAQKASFTSSGVPPTSEKYRSMVLQNHSMFLTRRPDQQRSFRKILSQTEAGLTEVLDGVGASE
jgi:hypothetical protein